MAGQKVPARVREHSAVLLIGGALALLSPSVFAQQQPPAATTPAASSAPSAALQTRLRVANEAVRQLPPGTPAFVAHAMHQSLLAPGAHATSVPVISAPRPALRPGAACAPDAIYSLGAFPAVVPQAESDGDPAGCAGSYNKTGPTNVLENAFFQELGTNGRSCATCHLPPSGMSIGVANIQARLKNNHGTDPLFASVDGANCPNYLPPNIDGRDDFSNAHSLLLTRGLLRIFLPVPAGAEFTVKVVHDIPVGGHPGCNSDPQFNQDTDANGQAVQILSFFRRPRVAANLTFIMAAGGASPGPTLMWDGRETSLESQARDATFDHGHAQSAVPPTPQQINQIVAFERGVFTAQSFAGDAGQLDAAGASGGPQPLSAAPVGQSGPPTFAEFQAWSGLQGNPANAARAAIARGESIFNTRTFTISNVAGLNDAQNNNSIQGTCGTCHSQVHAGDNVKARAVNIGLGGGSSAHNGPVPDPALPIFEVACTGGKSTPFDGALVHTNDLGVAMISGKCADIGKFSGPQLRALAARAPYFSDGSASDLQAVVDFYNRRFQIGLTAQEQQDLIAFLNSL